jgi:hypothetical protein
VPGCEVAVLGGVLAEGGEEDAVLESEASDFEGGEEFGDWGAVWLRVRGCAAGRVLQGGEVGDLSCVRRGLE